MENYGESQRTTKLKIGLSVILIILKVIAVTVSLSLIPVYLQKPKPTPATITIENLGELDVIRRSIHFRALPNLTNTTSSVCSNYSFFKI